MTHATNATHDPALASWVDGANAPDTDFPVQNLPYGVFSRAGSGDAPRVGVAIGDQLVDVRAALAAGLLDGAAARAAERCRAPVLNALMASPADELSALRAQLSALLRNEGAAAAAARGRAAELLVRQADVALHLPCAVGDYTDFYASVYHATNVGSMFRPDNPLLPNYKYVPIGYHGRASSIVVSGTPVRRPRGQIKPGDAATPLVAPTRLLDYESELGLFVGRGNALGSTIPLDAAGAHLFGSCLVNDWSARDVQAWEYQPLGPFLSKSFATSVSPWVVTLEALAPFRAPAFARDAADPEPLPYLRSANDAARGGLDVTLEVRLATAAMRGAGHPPALLSRARFTDMYWTPAQLLAHHASNGCNLRPGDLLGSGTVSGAAPESRGCLLELTWRGAEPVTLPSGESRRFLEDGDEVVIRATAPLADGTRGSLGEVRGRVLPARG